MTSFRADGDRGRVDVVSSVTGATIHRIEGTVPGMFLGLSAAGIGDVDGDGIDDIAAGAPALVGPDGGEVLVFSGATGLEIWRAVGEAPGDFFGYMVANVHDVDGDGIDDVGVGAIGHDTPAVNAGKAYVLSGVTGAVVHSWTGAAANDNFGGSVGFAGDRGR